MLLLKTHQSSQESLTDHVYELEQNRDLQVRKQSLHDKFSSAAVAFMREVISHQLKSTTAAFEQEASLKTFSKVFIQDATKFGLPEKLQKEYPCYGGRAAKAGGQIQFTYELKNQKVCHLELYPATRSEALSATDNSWIERGALVLRDLGYFTIKGFREIIDKKAFFISRAKPKTSFYYPDDDQKKFNIKKLLSKMKSNGIDYCEEDLIMGFTKKNKLPVRVIFSRVPDEVKASRLRKASKNAKERNWQVTKDYKIWAGINVYITNIPSDQMATKDIALSYRLRWQVELIFKTWKSHYRIHTHKAVKKERIECYLYASLLLILLQTYLFSWLYGLSSKQGTWLSIHKFCKLMIHLKGLFSKAILKYKGSFNELLQTLLYHSKEMLIKEEKKGRVGYGDIISQSL